MNDIVEALRAFGKHDCDCEHPGKRCPESLGWKAADEIDQLRARVEASRQVIDALRTTITTMGERSQRHIATIARARDYAQRNKPGFAERTIRNGVLAILDGDDE